MNDVLLLAGDVCHQIKKLEMALGCLREKFAEVFYLPGNHELWTLESECSDSLQKFHQIVELCHSLNVRMNPAKMEDGHGGVWVVPLFSWYDKPEAGESSLFLPRSEQRPDEMAAWADEHFVHWPGSGRPTTFFLDFNQHRLRRVYDAPIISFSHFLPRSDLMFPPRFIEAGKPLVWPSRAGFNFSRVAGTWTLDEQIRKLGSRIHAYGHQHRNRSVLIDGVLYVSHCLGYPQERKSGRIGYFEQGPRLIWESGRPAIAAV
jgi:hypothetical protein